LKVIDELPNVRRDDQIAIMYSILQEKEAGWSLKISDNIKIVVAGNTPEWSEIVSDLPKPLKGRVTFFRVDPPSIDEWYEYMNTQYGDKWDKFTYAYLKLYPADFLKNSDVPFENYPSPRSWTRLALQLYEYDGDDEMIDELSVGNVGKEVGVRFSSLRRTKMTEEEINNIITFPPKFEQIDMNRKLLLINSVASKIDKTNYTKYLEFIKYLQKHREFLMLLLNLATKDVRIILSIP